MIFSNKKRISEAELNEIRELQRIVSFEKFKAQQVKGNTAIIPNGRGKAIAEELEAMAELFENHMRIYIGQILARLGFSPMENVSINMKTGKVESKGIRQQPTPPPTNP
jgi:hypothetical protein